MLTDGPSKSEIDTLMQKSKGLLNPAKAAAILRRYDNNLKKATNAISTRLPVATKRQDSPRNCAGDCEGGTDEVAERPRPSPSIDFGTTIATSDDIFDWLETLQLNTEPNSHINTLQSSRAAQQSNYDKNEQIAALQGQLEDLRGRMEKVVVRLEELGERMK